MDVNLEQCPALWNRSAGIVLDRAGLGLHRAGMGTSTQPPASFMGLALAEAQAAAGRGEVPVGAVVVERQSARILAADGNRVIERRDPTAHAEMLVIRRAAGELASERLVGCDLYVTLEPCPMCAQAISLARIDRLYYGADDPKGGGVAHGPRLFAQITCHHRPEVFDGIQETRATALLRDFFADRR